MFKFPSFSHSIKRVMKNFAANALGQLMNGVYQFISFPLFLHYWTTQGYGEWLVLFAIPSILWSLEGGLSGVAANRMTVASGAGNWELVNTLFQNVFLAQAILTLVVIGGTALFVSTVNVHAYLHFTWISPSHTSIILMLLICYMLAGFYISLFRAVYRVAELEHRGVMVNNLFRLSDFCVSAVVLISGRHALVLAMAMLAHILCWCLFVYFDARRSCPRIEFGIRRASWAVSKSVLVDGTPLLAGQAAMALFLQGYPLVINGVLGAAAVVPFTGVRTISRVLLQANQVVGFSSAPEVSRSYGRQDWPTYLRLLKIMLASAMGAGLVTLIGLTLLGPWAIHLWTGGKVTMGHAPLFLFAISTALQGIYAVGGLVLVCSNMHHTYNYLYLLVTVLALGLAHFALPYLGFIAVPATMVVQDLTLALLVVMLCRSKLKHIELDDLRSLFRSDFYWGKVQALFNRAEY